MAERRGKRLVGTNPFENVQFKGAFRSYQQKVLDESLSYISDSHIHIVAAPGSGKTVLGLELIRRLGAPALVLSPTVVVSRQWGDRFAELFSPDDMGGSGNADAFVSYSLKEPRPITSITYQGIHAAYRKLAEARRAGGVDADADADADSEDLDFRDFDLPSFIRTHGVGTICLDEAHHLKQEWQRSLEGFLNEIRGEVKVIALTATPPYDSGPAEWGRYIQVSGEIDVEIFVPELVAQGTLCPHQDYICFNYPTLEEMGEIYEFRDRTAACMEEALFGGIMDDVLNAAWRSFQTAAKVNRFAEYGQENTALAAVALHTGRALPGPVSKGLGLLRGRALPPFSREYAERAINHVLAHPEVFTENVAERMRGICAKYRVLRHGRAELYATERLDRKLVSSLGKLASIVKIVQAEYRELGDSLRQVILTDYIRKEHLRFVGTGERLSSIGAVPIFETVRRALPAGAKLALVSGSLVIWPDSGIGTLTEIARPQGVEIASAPLVAGYRVVTFIGSNRKKVAVATEAFQGGHVQILIGTSALLGEGWDSPCVNSLILASFVGSYVLSNQMRGRAIRTSPGDPKKTANIWHLVALEPQADMSMPARVLLEGPGPESGADPERADEKPTGADFDALRRRFRCFFGPDYSGGEIRSGIERIDIIRPPFDPPGIEQINAEMFRRAADRQGMAGSWKNCLQGDCTPDILDVNAVPRELRAEKPFIRSGGWQTVAGGAVLAVCIRLLIGSLIAVHVIGLAPAVFFAAVAAGFAIFAFRSLQRFLRAVLPERMIGGFAKAIRATMRETGELQAREAEIRIETRWGGRTVCSLEGGAVTVREKNRFADALGEMFSPIKNPRYLAVQRKMGLAANYNFYQSYACPSFVSTAAAAKKFEKNLKRHCDKSFTLVYTRSENGYWLLSMCRNLSILTLLDLKGKGVLRFLKVRKT
ncbi:MAG: DEAD/DEAH box helicase family protein [Clostridiales Family XIII bacterium]|jgi:superfamily II DNA or RNA helicase|nr:DEAD/DEAH box helicase family protein [Clostridiales Family XIII bacterium]